MQRLAYNGDVVAFKMSRRRGVSKASRFTRGVSKVKGAKGRILTLDIVENSDVALINRLLIT